MKVTEVKASNGEILRKKIYMKGEHNHLSSPHIEYTKKIKVKNNNKMTTKTIAYNPDGPSIICFNGTEYYTNSNGDIHKDDGPAVIVKKRYKKKGQYTYKVVNFQFHSNGQYFAKPEDMPNNLFMIYCKMKLAWERNELQKIYDFDDDVDNPFNT